MGKMTPEEFEIAFCKGRSQEMDDFVEWLDDHIMVARGALKDGVSPEKVLERTIGFMEKLKGRMEEKLQNGPKFISKKFVEGRSDQEPRQT